MDLYWGLAFVFVVLVIEEIGLPLPFVSPGIMVALSIQWRLGLVPLWAILITAACASATGTLILYAAGIYGARPLLLRYGSWVRLPEPRLLDLENRIRGHAFWTILSARFIPGLTAVSSMLAGTLRIPVLVVLAAGQITSLTWTLFWLTVGNVGFGLLAPFLAWLPQGLETPAAILLLSISLAALVWVIRWIMEMLLKRR
ncbi:MAG: DedA family protein [Chloroflexota bacterium]